jgi:hypothetical protein
MVLPEKKIDREALIKIHLSKVREKYRAIN